MEPKKEIRLRYKAALAERDYTGALHIMRENPHIFGEPAPDAPDEIAAVANDPSEPKWMIVEWSVQKNKCKQAPCRAYVLNSRQFDHKGEGISQEELDAWFNRYVQNRTDAKGGQDQLGVTLYLVKVEKIKQITDFKGELI